jgi:uncharacterized protein YlzI (FlbEa/FlbD family)
MLHIELCKEHFETMMFITNGKQLINKHDIMDCLEKFFYEQEINYIKSCDDELLCFSEVR